MGYPHTSSFSTLRFPKTGKEIKEKCAVKSKNLAGRIKLRQDTINEALTKHGLSTIEVMTLMQGDGDGFYNTTPVNYSASDASLVKAKEGFRTKDWEAIEGEHKRLKSEGDELEKLQKILRNLPDDRSFDLTFDDLEYYEF